jgi:hypothetical protein
VDIGARQRADRIAGGRKRIEDRGALSDFYDFPIDVDFHEPTFFLTFSQKFSLMGAGLDAGPTACAISFTRARNV